jgi:hypothetical protein
VGLEGGKDCCWFTWVLALFRPLYGDRQVHKDDDDAREKDMTEGERRRRQEEKKDSPSAPKGGIIS